MRIAGHAALLTALMLVLAAGAAATVAHRAASAPARASAFGISAPRPARPLRPGQGFVLDLRLRNPYRHALRITRLHVALEVDARHRALGCRRHPDFRVTQVPAVALPLRLGARQARPLSRLGVRTLPRVALLNLRRRNQGACKGATLRLRYTGRATKAKG